MDSKLRTVLRKMSVTTTLFRLFVLFYLAFSFFAICSCYRPDVDGNISRRVLRNSLKGKELRIVTGHFPPVISIIRNSSGYIIGYTDQLYFQFLYLAMKLKFTYKIFPAAENSNGIKINGSWNGIIGALQRGEADFGLVPVAISLERYEAIEFCGRVGGDYTGILIKYPEGSVSFTSAFDVYSAGVWMGWIISGMTVVAISFVLTSVAKRMGASVGEMKTKDIAWYLYGTFLSQGSDLPRNHSSQQKILSVTWCFVAFVFVNIYNSTLTSYMSVRYQKPEINSFHDLATHQSYKATILTGSIQDMDLLEANIEELKIVAERVKKCSSDCRKFNFPDMVNPVLEKENYVSIIPWRVGSSYLQKYNSNQCRLALAYERSSWKPMFFAVPKSSPYIEEINREALWFMDVGLNEYNKKPRNMCKLNYNRNGVSIKTFSSRIVLKQFYLAFVILFVGYLLAFMQFCHEKFCSFRKSN